MIVCLAGMHRSGTSLFSSYLQYCGISMGEQQAGPGYGNPHGHYEDRKFLELHKKILNYNKQHMYFCKKKITVSHDDREYAKALVYRNSQKYDNWGWKDPRTTLFLDFWENLCKEIKYVFLYRNPYRVIDSLFRRRGDRIFYLMPHRAADAWLLYNQRIIDFHKRFPEKSVIISIDEINRSPETTIPVLSDWMGYTLDKPYHDVYRPKAISTSVSLRTAFYLPIIRAFRSAQLEHVMTILNSRALIPDTQSD